MGIYLNPGYENYRRTLAAEIYVDKTMMIAEMNKFIDRGNNFVCVSRPRRFGKTITGNMLNAYYSKGCDSKELFAPYKIASEPGFEDKLNKYNVIKLDINGAYQNIRDKDNMLDVLTEKIKAEMRKEFPKVPLSEEYSLAEAILKIYEETEETFILIFDEYDVMVREQVSEELFAKFLGFLNGLFKDHTTWRSTRMGIYLNPGNSGFKEILRSEYVDKSKMIGLINRTIGTRDKLTCISRPRRFGKSYAAQMLCAYYDKTCDSRFLFDDLYISEDSTYETHLNVYDVIYVDMTGIIGETRLSDIVSYVKRNILEEISEAYPEVKIAEGFAASLANTVNDTGTQFIMIIDEWDAPIREAKDRADIQKEYLDFLRSLFKNSGSTAKIFAAAYMTGILPIKKDGSQSAISDFNEYSVLDPGSFSEYIGFTENEVRSLCQKKDISFQSVKRWYDGYTFLNVPSIYNPYSVMNAIQKRRFQSYWNKTSAAEALLTYIDMNEDGLQEEIARLITGESIQIDPGGFRNDFTSFHGKDDVLTLLVHLGYLAFEEKYESYDEDIESISNFVRIPNEEIRIEFNKILRKGKHNRLIELVKVSDQLLADTIAGKENSVAEAFEKIRDLEYSPGFYNDEQALRYAIKFAYISCVDQYLKIEEMPSGRGIADVVFVPKRNSSLPAIIIELKWNKTAGGALSQIRERNYPAVLRQYDGKIILVGVNYDAKTKKHTCKIEFYD